MFAIALCCIIVMPAAVPFSLVDVDVLVSLSFFPDCTTAIPVLFLVLQQSQIYRGRNDSAAVRRRTNAALEIVVTIDMASFISMTSLTEGPNLRYSLIDDEDDKRIPMHPVFPRGALESRSVSVLYPRTLI